MFPELGKSVSHRFLTVECEGLKYRWTTLRFLIGENWMSMKGTKENWHVPEWRLYGSKGRLPALRFQRMETQKRKRSPKLRPYSNPKPNTVQNQNQATKIKSKTKINLKTKLRKVKLV